MAQQEMRYLVERKRDGAALCADDWNRIIAWYMRREIGEDQMAALCMACVLRGMNFDETLALTRALVESGEVLSFHDAQVMDKHSTGGVGDTTSLLVVPIVAACGVAVAKLAGRALGHTGGTIDKLETVDGLRTDLSPKEFCRQVEGVGCAIAAQSESLVPADKRLYALRDRTGTVPSPGLIAASIVSKKIAGGAKVIVFDVKVGGGAFIRDVAVGQQLAGLLVELTERFGRRSIAIVSNMDEPLGPSIGTGLEIIEARDFLSGASRDARLEQLSLHLVAQMLRLGGKEASEITGFRALESGAAYATFIAMIEAQGSSRGALESMRAAPQRREVRSTSAGYVAAIGAEQLGDVARGLYSRDRMAGLRAHVRVGDAVEVGSLLLTVYGAADMARVGDAFVIERQAPLLEPLVYAAVAPR
ncbi:MAG: thymidine phosphorylase [Candidatus Eremiobacteraeota bacterium]|nr:thymidine phosphorylase [Candidatus Eremiobacteraeota bacterium]